ncbi:MAG: MMPL family transporter [Candidatus Aminicenantes bacterium]|nr:MMPL family transporter [Candidatus Aminicenantes bacterium]
MEKIWTRCLKLSLLIILLIIILTFFFVLQYKDIQFQNKFTSWLPQDDPVVKLLVDTGENFGSTELVLVTIKAREGETFCPEILQALKEATEELRQQKEVFYVTSIITAPHIERAGDEVLVKDFLEEIPTSQDELSKKLQEALNKENYVHTYISPDGQWLGAAVYLRSGVDSAAAFEQVVKRIMEKHLREKTELHYSGEPCFTYYADFYLKKDLGVLIPIIILTVLLILYLSFRTLRAVFLPSLVVWLSTAWVFGLMGLFHVPMNLMTPALPVLLIGLGSAYGLHLVNGMEQNRTEGLSRSEWVARSSSRVALPVFMAAATTAVGFASFLTAKLGLIYNFGIFAAAGILLAMLIALALIPSVYYLLPEQKARTRERVISLVNPQFFRWLAARVIKYQRIIIVATLIILIFFVLWIPRIKREVNFTNYFPAESEPRQADRIVRSHFDGAAPLSLYFKTASLKTASALRVLRRAENFMLSLPDCGLPLSVADLVEELNEKMNGRYSLPETDGQVANLWFLLEGRDELRQLISDDFTEGLVFSRTSATRTEKHWVLRRAISDFLSKEMRQNFKAISLNGVSLETATELRKKEANFLLDELEWLLIRYAPGKQIPRAEIQKQLGYILTNWPVASDPEVVAEWRSELENYIRPESFDFVLTEGAAKKLIAELTDALVRDQSSREDFQRILRKVVKDARYDEETTEGVISTLQLRLKEVREKVVLEREKQILLPLMPEEARQNANFLRRFEGLLLEINDELVVLPEKNLGPVEQSAGELVKDVIFERIDQSGLPPALTQLDHYLFVSQLQSFALALLLTFIIMMLIRRSLKLGLISVTPIVFTLGVIYGFFGLAGVELDYVTMMVASVSIGVGIDYSIHFVHGVMMGLKQGRNMEEAITLAFQEKGAAIMANSLSVMMGFAVLLLASMSPLRTFGGIMVGSMFLAALSALTILPALLLRVKVT